MPIRRRHLAGLAWATSATWAASPASSALAAGSAAQTCPTLRVGVLVFPGLNQRGPGGRIEGFDADPTLRLGIVRKALRPASVQAWVDALAAQGRVSESTDSASLLRAYEAGRVHAMLVFAGSMRDQPAAWQAEQRFFAWWPDYWQTFGWAASRAAVAAEWRERLRAAAEAARKDGSLQRLAQRYWGGSGEPMFEVLAAPPG